MTAISAAIVELEAQRERMSTLITELRRHERAIKASYPQAPTLIASRTTTALSTKKKRNSTTTSASVPTTPTSSDAARVLRAIEVAGGVAVSRAEIGTPGRMSGDAVRRALRELVKAGQIRARGKTSGKRYTLASAPQSGPGAAAGTQAAPPVGLPPANGSRQPGNFDVVWNGTKERNGEASSILGPRERKP